VNDALTDFSFPGRSAARSSSRSGALQSRGPGYVLKTKLGCRFCEASLHEELRAASRPGYARASSLPGLTRQSIILRKMFLAKMDGYAGDAEHVAAIVDYH
jgi:hypothetical protein